MIGSDDINPKEAVKQIKALRVRNRKRQKSFAERKKIEGARFIHTYISKEASQFLDEEVESGNTTINDLVTEALIHLRNKRRRQAAIIANKDRPKRRNINTNKDDKWIETRGRKKLGANIKPMTPKEFLAESGIDVNKPYDRIKTRAYVTELLKRGKGPSEITRILNARNAPDPGRSKVKGWIKTSVAQMISSIKTEYGVK